MGQSDRSAISSTDSTPPSWPSSSPTPSCDAGLGTVYTAHYRPAEGRVTYYWPEESWAQSFDDFTVGSRRVAIGSAG